MIEGRKASLCAGYLLICLAALGCSGTKLGGLRGRRMSSGDSSRNGILLKRSEEHNAILNWKAPLSGKRNPLTLDFQRALVRADGHPTTFEARIRDVFSKSDKEFLLLSASDSPRKLDLVLEVPPAIEEQVLALASGESRDVVAIADIGSVDRADPGATGPDLLVARGTCVALYDFSPPKPPEAPKK